jgi:hypothetical protein
VIYTATNSSLQKRTEEAIRYAIEYKLGEWGTLYATRAGQPDLIVADPSIVGVTVPSAGDSIWIGDTSHVIDTITYSASFPSGWRITTEDSINATAGDAVRINYSLNVRRSDDMRSREAITWLIFVQVIVLREDDPGSDYYTGNLIVSLHSLYNTVAPESGPAVTDETLLADIEPHDEKIGRLNSIISDVPGIWALVAPDTTGRPILDLSIHAILAAEEPSGVSSDGLHNWETRRRIRVSRTDII